MTQLASNSMWEPSAAFTQTTNSRTELVVKSAGISKNSSGKCEACRTRKSVVIDKYRNMSYNVILEKFGVSHTKENTMGKGKAKRNSKKPTGSFKERCKRALLKNIAGFGGEMEKDPTVAFEFDIDNKTIDRRVEAIAETRDMAVAIAKEYIPEDLEVRYEAEWGHLNMVMTPPFNIGERQFNYSLAAAIWILDAIKANHKMDEALALLPKDEEQLASIELPSCVSPCYSEAVIRSMVYIILHRNEDCVGINNPEKPPLKYPVTDSYTVGGKQHQNVPSRNVFDAIVGLLPEDKVDNAVNMYAIQVRGAISRYFCCRSKWVKEEKKCLDEIHRFDDELNKVSDEANAFSKKTHSMVKAKAIPLAKNNMPGVGAKTEMTIGLHSITERGETIVAKLEAMQTELQKLNELERDFAYDSAECAYWTKETWAKKYSSAVAKRAVMFEVMDPYAVCFAFYYMMDNGDNLPWLYYPSCVLLSYAAAQLPWCGGAVKQCLDATGQSASYIDANTSKLHLMEDNLTSDSSVVPICWNTMSLVQQEGADAKTPVRMTPAAAVYTYTDGVLVPRNTASVDPVETALTDLGVTSPEGRAVYAAYISLLSNLKDRIDFPNDTKDECDALRAKCDTYEAEIEKLKNKDEKNKQGLYKAEKTISELTTAIEKASVEHEKEKQELNDLRELVFALTNDADSAAREDTKTQVAFPYHTTKKHIVFGGHPSWLKAIRPMVPDVKFVDGVPSTEQIKGADIVWLQTNYLSHKAFYKIIDIVRSKNIPLRYFTSASAAKCAEQVVNADQQQ